MITIKTFQTPDDFSKWLFDRLVSEKLIKKELADIYKETYNESIPNLFCTTNTEGDIKVHPHTYDLVKMLGFTIETTGHKITLSEPVKYIASLTEYEAKNTMN